ncbi:MAG: hypothetical protein D6690_05350 [Nitrospirae bacterium]|nr:MAG: hypothetical protein D6690_05350 [Nitrospirota bacterium]
MNKQKVYKDDDDVYWVQCPVCGKMQLAYAGLLPEVYECAGTTWIVCWGGPEDEIVTPVDEAQPEDCFSGHKQYKSAI